MKTITKSVFTLIIFLFSFVSITVLVNADASTFSEIESQITPESNDEKIKKLQTLFKELGLYNGVINGEYNSIKDDLIKYQISAGIITHSEDWGAGYFGKKTILALKEEFQNTFEEKKEIIKKKEPTTEEQYFVITGYYSPLPGQKRYTTGSYAGDIRLNGGGKITASGNGVFPGLLAAPRNYNYGTKIYFEGIGIGSVEDRGGAIVNAGERGHTGDRIDIWMGYGDEGLERALKWGKRTVKGQIVASDAQISIEFEMSPVTKYDSLQAGPKSTETTITQLQKLFTQLDLYSGEIDGNYSSIESTLIKYQLDNNIIASEFEDGAGYFGPKTIANLRKRFPGGFFKEKKLVIYHTPLSFSDQRKMKRLKAKIDVFLDKKTGGDASKIRAYRIKLKQKIALLANKQKNQIKKEQLNFLGEIL